MFIQKLKIKKKTREKPCPLKYFILVELFFFSFFFLNMLSHSFIRDFFHLDLINYFLSFQNKIYDCTFGD